MEGVIRVLLYFDLVDENFFVCVNAGLDCNFFFEAAAERRMHFIFLEDPQTHTNHQDRNNEDSEQGNYPAGKTARRRNRGNVEGARTLRRVDHSLLCKNLCRLQLTGIVAFRIHVSPLDNLGSISQSVVVIVESCLDLLHETASQNNLRAGNVSDPQHTLLVFVILPERVDRENQLVLVFRGCKVKQEAETLTVVAGRHGILN